MKKEINSLFLLKIINFLIIILLNLSVTHVTGQSKSRKDELVKLFSEELYKNPDKAIRTAREFLKKSNNNIDDKIKAYKLISDGYSAKRDYEKSLDYLMKSNELLPLSENYLLKISITNKTGILYHQLKIYDKAIQSLDQAEQYISEYPMKDSVFAHLGKNFIVRGFIYKEKLNPDIAIEFFDKGIEELKKANSILEYPGISIAKYNKGNCYILLFEYEKALINFQEAIAYAEIINAESLKSFALKGQAKVYFMQGNYYKSIELLNKAKLFSVNINDLILNKEIYEGLAENYLAINEWNLFEENKNLLSSTQELIKESERKSIETSLVNKKAEIKSNFKKEIPKLFGIIIFLFCIIILSFFIFLYFKKKLIRKINDLNVVISNLQNEKFSDS